MFVVSAFDNGMPVTETVEFPFFPGDVFFFCNLGGILERGICLFNPLPSPRVSVCFLTHTLLPTRVQRPRHGG